MVRFAAVPARPHRRITIILITISIGFAGLGMPSAAADTPTVLAPLVTGSFARDGAADVVFVAGSFSAAVVSEWSMTITADPGGKSVTVTDPEATTARITGLTNGSTYRFKAIQTVNGTSSLVSPPSPPVTPRAAERPLAPTIDSVLSRDGALIVNWNPGSDGGSPIRRYQVAIKVSSGTGYSASYGVGNVRTFTIPKLTNGVSYKIRVLANNRVGNSPEAVLAVINYKVTASPGGVSKNVAGTETKTTLTGLDPDTLYAITVTSDNGISTPGPVTREVADVDNTATARPHASLRRGAIELPAESINSITDVTATTVQFTNTNDAVRGLQPDDIIAVAPKAPLLENGLLRKIVTLTKSGNGANVTLHTVEATLQEAIGASTMQLAPPENWTENGRATSLVPGMRVASASFDRRIDLEFSYEPKTDSDNSTELQTELNAGFSAALSGQLTITPEWKLNADIGWSGGVKSASVKATATVKASLEGRFSAFFSASAEPRTPLVKYQFTCVTYFIGWFPLVICPVFELHAKATVDGSLEFVFEATYEQKFGGELKYVSKNKWSRPHHQSKAHIHRGYPQGRIGVRSTSKSSSGSPSKCPSWI